MPYMGYIDVFVPIIAAILGAIIAIVCRHLYWRYMQPDLDVKIWCIKTNPLYDGSVTCKYSAILENKGRKTTENLSFSAYIGDGWNDSFHSTKSIDLNPGAVMHFDIAQRTNETLTFNRGKTEFDEYPVKLCIHISTKDVKQKEFVFFIQEDYTVTERTDVEPSTSIN